MNAVMQRLVELVGHLLERPLTCHESKELRESHQYITNYEYKFSRLMNLMHLARCTRDWDWFQNLAVEYHKLMG